MHLAEFGDFQRKVAIALGALPVDQHVARAIHRLQGIVAVIFCLGQKHVLAIILPMARGFPKGAIHDVGRVDLDVACLFLAIPHVADQGLEQPPAFCMPKDGAGCDFFKVKQVHFTAQLAVIAFLGFLHHGHMRVKRRFVSKGDAIDAAEHLVVAVTPPIGPRHAGQLKGAAHISGGAHMGPPAQI